MTTLFLIVSAVLIISFLCSIMEACVLSLSSVDLARISEKSPDAARTWRDLRKSIQKPITVILVINTLAQTMGTFFAGVTFDSVFGTKWIWLFTIVFSFAVIQWTEILPKTLGVRYNQAIAVVTGKSLKYLVLIFTPFVNMVQFLNRPFEGKNQGKSGGDSLEDISVLAKFAAARKKITKDQEQIMYQTINLPRIKAKNIMVQRDEIKYLSDEMSIGEALIEMHKHNHTRFPLIKGSSIDDVIGYVNLKDVISVMRTNPADPTLKGIRRPILEVNKDEQVPELLAKFTGGYLHIAVVRNSDGTTAGLVTLEDVIEAIVGEVEDEYDALPKYLYKAGENRYFAGGGVLLKDLKKKTNFNIPDTGQNLNEWFREYLGRKPGVEDRITYNDIDVTVRKIKRSNIFEVVIELRT
ncbi:MAG: hemolysin family protein [Candidatus Goldiibacteriota bacterium]